MTKAAIRGLTTAATIWATAFIPLVLVWLRGLEVRKANQADKEPRWIAWPAGQPQTPRESARTSRADTR